MVLGNCGVTFAPVRPGQERFLDALRRRPLGLDVGGLVGHCALHHFGMGDRSLARDEPPTAGALGFATSRSLLHTVPGGRPVHGTFATSGGLAAIARALADRGRETIEVVPRIGERDRPDRQGSVAELVWMEDVSRALGRPDRWAWVMDQVAAARARGADLRPLAPGAFAGLNVIDLAVLDLAAPVMQADLPLGAGRYVQRARGDDSTLVNGQVLVDHDELTGERPGHVVTPG